MNEIVEKAKSITTQEVIVQDLLKRGSDHHNFCQDALARVNTERFFYMAVFDGCSDGRDSHFASALFGKVFVDVINTLIVSLDETSNSLEKKSKFIIFQIARKLNETRHVLHLNTNEMLSTIVMAIVDKELKESLICVFGDGFFSVNGKHTVVKNTRFLNQSEGENKPDYIAYDLHKIQKYSDFEIWFDSKSEIHKFENVDDISIASDGISTFRSSERDSDINEVYDYLSVDDKFLTNTIMLYKKYNLLQSTFKLINTDDISMIRLKFLKK